MKIYTPQKQHIIRVNIKKQRFKTEHINLCDCTVPEVKTLVEKLIVSQNLSPFLKGNVTTVEIREARGSINGKSISISFRGLDPKEVSELILKNLTL